MTDRTSDDIVTELQEFQRQEDSIREQKRALNSELVLALVAEGKAVSPLANADLRDPAAREAIRAQLNALDKRGG